MGKSSLLSAREQRREIVGKETFKPLPKEIGVKAVATPPKSVDRRVRRTRQLLRQAALEVMQEKGFEEMTIQNITDRANVNRGTFYAHYPDKYALLEEIIREQFQQILATRLPAELKGDRRSLHLLIQIVLEHFGEEYRHCQPVEVIGPLLERATQEALAALFLKWLEQTKQPQARVPVETIARVMSWSILGAAAHWGREASERSSRQVADEVLLVIMEGVARLAPEAFVE